MFVVIWLKVNKSNNYISKCYYFSFFFKKKNNKKGLTIGILYHYLVIIKTSQKYITKSVFLKQELLNCIFYAVNYMYKLISIAKYISLDMEIVIFYEMTEKK